MLKQLQPRLLILRISCSLRQCVQWTRMKYPFYWRSAMAYYHGVFWMGLSNEPASGNAGRFPPPSGSVLSVNSVHLTRFTTHHSCSGSPPAYKQASCYNCLQQFKLANNHRFKLSFHCTVIVILFKLKFGFKDLGIQLIEHTDFSAFLASLVTNCFWSGSILSAISKVIFQKNLVTFISQQSDSIVYERSKTNPVDNFSGRLNPN